ncbi:unnamed protein product [Polarella glacialis]|uniref:Uncharacterized protein n=1 Tax=Polarella glacialis TaxID=89957 RepID=A0A813G607_POLGL|nr:unnamed protein product [Polarella glacialis]
MQHLAQIPWSLATLSCNKELDELVPAVAQAVKLKASTTNCPNYHALLWSLWKSPQVTELRSVFHDLVENDSNNNSNSNSNNSNNNSKNNSNNNDLAEWQLRPHDAPV